MQPLPFFAVLAVLVAASAGEAGAGQLPLERDNRADAVPATTDPHLNSSSWQLARPGFPAAWAMSTGSPETVIAVLDTGVGPHADLGPQVPGYDFVDDDADPSDSRGHGTAVAGIINAVPNNGIGISGACWSCRVMPVRVLGEREQGNWAHVAKGIVWAVDHGADVINLSLSSTGAGPDVADAVAYALAHDVVLVASAGNRDLAEAGFPAAFPGVLSVGAIDSQDARYTLAGTLGKWGSNYGPAVALAAPGCTQTIWFGGLYVGFCGTSAATPFVAALAGLLRSYYPTASGKAVADAIRVSAVPHPEFVNGRIDAAAAMRALTALPPKPPKPPTPPAAPTPARDVAPTLKLGLRTNKTRVMRGRLVTFKMTVTSDADAGWAYATIELPPTLKFISASSSDCVGRQNMSCELGELRAGKPTSVIVVARLRARGPLTLRATVRTVEGVTTEATRWLTVYGR